VRIRTPGDIGLRVLRAAIVAAAAAAVAAPVWITAARRAAWDARTVRVIVLDTSASMQRRAANGSGTAADRARELAASLTPPAHRVETIEAERLDAALADAVRAFDRLPPARREIAIVSDFQRGSISSATLARVPAGIGVRLVRVAPESRAGPLVVARRVVGAPDGAIAAQDVTAIATAHSTSVRAVPASGPAAEWIRFDGSEEERRGAAASLAAARAAGIAAPDATMPVRVVLRSVVEAGHLPEIGNQRERQGAHARPTPGASGAGPRSGSAEAGAALPRVVRRVAADSQIADEARKTDGHDVPEGWLVLHRGINQKPVIAVTVASQGHLAVANLLPAASVGTAILLRTIADGLSAEAPVAELEPVAIADEDLRSLERAPAPLDEQTIRNIDLNDGRWLWALALALLGIEWRVQRRRAYADAEEDRAAAA
jgi:hypothetical protein